jgi:NitT/TauT family transport system substrate-binding protein
MTYKFRDVGALTGEVPEWSKISNADVLRSLQVTDVAQQSVVQPTFEKLPAAAVAKAEAVAQKGVTIEFPYNSDALTDEARLLLDQELKTVVTSFAGARFRVEGNTDSQGDDRYNLDLSRRRAQSVASYLATRFNFDPDKFSVQGNGEGKPVADNGTPAGRARNRRTDVQILSTQ